MKTVTITVNGTPCRRAVPDEMTLLHFLRDEGESPKSCQPLSEWNPPFREEYHYAL